MVYGSFESTPYEHEGRGEPDDMRGDKLREAQEAVIEAAWDTGFFSAAEMKTARDGMELSRSFAVMVSERLAEFCRNNHEPWELIAPSIRALIMSWEKYERVHPDVLVKPRWTARRAG